MIITAKNEVTSLTHLVNVYTQFAYYRYYQLMEQLQKNLEEYDKLQRLASKTACIQHVYIYSKTWLSSAPGCQAPAGCEVPTCLLSKSLLQTLI